MEAQSSQLVCESSGPPLRVLFDGRKLGDGGIGVYINNTVEGLLRGSSGIQISVIATEKQAERASWRKEVTWVFDNARPYSLSEYLLLPRRIDFSAYDIFHAPHYTLPFGIRIPSVVTIHDLIHVDHPERFYYPFIARRLVRSAIKRADAVIAVSEATRNALVELLCVPSTGIDLIPNAVSSAIRSKQSQLQTTAPESCAELRQRLSGAPYFIAVVSNLKPHKGVDDLIKAYSELRGTFTSSAAHGVCPRLLLVGFGAAELLQGTGRFSRDAATEGIEIVGVVSPEQLRELYASSIALVVASHVEGFCLPALEAQSVGTRVVCRPVPALLELVTSKDMVARDFSSEALAAVLQEAASDRDYPRDVDEKHLERFSLVGTAQQLAQVYRRVAQREEMSALEAA